MIPDRELPNSPEAERALLGSVFLASGNATEFSEVWNGVREIIPGPEAFWNERNRAWWRAMLAHSPGPTGFDGAVLRSAMGDEFEKLGGYEYLGGLLGTVASYLRWREYATVVVEKYARRCVISAAARSMNAAFDDKTLADVQGELENLVRLVTTDGSGPGPVLLNMADVNPESISWLWPGRIARGKVTLVAGDPGLGKSFLTLDLAARVSRGVGFPDCPGAMNPAGGVVLLSAEDDPGDTIRPRLDAADADVERINILTAIKDATGDGPAGERQFNLARDIHGLERAIKRTPDCKLIIIDPITAYLGGTDSHKNAEVRAVLTPLSEIAARLDVAVVCVTHLRKGDGVAIYRAMGSLAFIAAARSAWLVTKDQDDETGRRRLFLPLKNNIGPDVGGLAFELHPVGETACLAWDDSPVNVTADEALSQARTGDGEERGAVDEAADWLRDFLADGPKPARDIFRRAVQDGISEKTLKRAKRDMGVKARKDGFADGWSWRLPVNPDCRRGPSVPEEAQQNTLAPFEDCDPLRAGPAPATTPNPAPAPTAPEPAAAWIVGDVLAEPRDGWTPGAWATNLIRMAERCAAANPERAAELRTAAARMRDGAKGVGTAALKKKNLDPLA